MNNRMCLILLLALLCLILLSSCAPGISGRNAKNRAGFFMGIWHGWIAPITLIWQLFNPAVRIYEPYNTGWFYDLGYYIAVISGIGSISFSRRCRR